MIDKRFINCRIDNYRCINSTQQEMKEAALQYLAWALTKEETDLNSLGYVAKVGESVLNSITDPITRTREKENHNSFGLGKTHLTSAVAMELIRNGLSVLAVKDDVIMTKLMDSKRSGEGEYEHLINTLINVPVLLWDDIGKSNSSEPKRAAYCSIFDGRDRLQKKTMYSTNEDLISLTDKIGDGAASRLLGMTRHLVKCEGEDWRLSGEVRAG